MSTGPIGSGGSGAPLDPVAGATVFRNFGPHEEGTYIEGLDIFITGTTTHNATIAVAMVQVPVTTDAEHLAGEQVFASGFSTTNSLTIPTGTTFPGWIFIPIGRVVGRHNRIMSVRWKPLGGGTENGSVAVRYGRPFQTRNAARESAGV